MNIKHGMSHLPEYSTWEQMKNRCYNKNGNRYAEWGGRGIKVCEQWKESFKHFYTDMGSKPTSQHSIDRIDNDGDYCPENCRWATKKEQSTNRSSTVWLTAYGVTQPISEWAKTLEVRAKRIEKRIKYGWSDHAALFTKPKQKKVEE